MKQFIISKFQLLFRVSFLCHLIDRKIGNEHAGSRVRLPLQRLWDISDCEVDRIGGFAASKMSELCLIRGNDDRSKGSTKWEEVLYNNR